MSRKLTKLLCGLDITTLIPRFKAVVPLGVEFLTDWICLPTIRFGELLPERAEGEHDRWYPLVFVAGFVISIIPSATIQTINSLILAQDWLLLLSLLEELGRGLTHDEWGESWVVCRRLESWGAYGEEFSGRETGIGDIPEDCVSPDVGVDWSGRQTDISKGKYHLFYCQSYPISIDVCTPLHH